MPDEKHHERAEGRAYQSRALIMPIPSDALAEQRGDERSSNSQEGGYDEPLRIVGAG
jgi:hypothetical protein